MLHNSQKLSGTKSINLLNHELSKRFHGQFISDEKKKIVNCRFINAFFYNLVNWPYLMSYIQQYVLLNLTTFSYFRNWVRICMNTLAADGVTFFFSTIVSLINDFSGTYIQSQNLNNNLENIYIYVYVQFSKLRKCI